jgi:hypothetical protein
VGLQCPQEATQRADNKWAGRLPLLEEMAIRPAVALLGLSGEQDREVALRPRSPKAALVRHNRDRPEEARSDVPDTLAGSKLDATVYQEGSVLRNRDQPGHYRATRYKRENLLPLPTPMTGLHSPTLAPAG